MQARRKLVRILIICWTLGSSQEWRLVQHPTPFVNDTHDADGAQNPVQAFTSTSAQHEGKVSRRHTGGKLGACMGTSLQSFGLERTVAYRTLSIQKSAGRGE